MGILPERRRDPERITQKSIMNWAKTVFVNGLKNKDIYFIEVTINEDTGNIFRPTPFFVTENRFKR